MTLNDGRVIREEHYLAPAEAVRALGIDISPS
jgi:hypothetical protein